MDMMQHGRSQSHRALHFYSAGWVTTAATVVFYVAWWMHLLIILSFLVYIPQSKHAHLIAGPINVFLNRLDNPGKLKPIDFEEEILDKEGNQYSVSEKYRRFHAISNGGPICMCGVRSLYKYVSGNRYR